MIFWAVGASRCIGIAPTILAAWLQHEHMSSAPRSFVEYVIVGIAAVIMVWTLVKATQWTISPGEHDPDHIKRTILDDDFVEPPRAKK